MSTPHAKRKKPEPVKMKRVVSTRRRTPAEAAKDREIIAKVKTEFPPASAEVVAKQQAEWLAAEELPLGVKVTHANLLQALCEQPLDPLRMCPMHPNSPA